MLRYLEQRRVKIKPARTTAVPIHPSTKAIGRASFRTDKESTGPLNMTVQAKLSDSRVDVRPQQDLAAQRVAARGRLSTKFRDGRTRLDRLFEEGAARLRLPRRRSDPLEAVLINTAGGLTGGDRIDWRFEVGSSCRATLTTQACEKIYRSAEGVATVRTKIEIADRGRACWLPQETIVYDQGHLVRSLDVDLATDAEVLIVEPIVFGRLAMGERVDAATLRDCWRIRREGRLIHAEDFRLGPDAAAQLGKAAVADGGIAMATVLLVSEQAERHLDAVRSTIGAGDGASAWRVGQSGKLLARLVAKDSYALRKRLVPLLGLLNGEADLPRIWSV